MWVLAAKVSPPKEHTGLLTTEPSFQLFVQIRTHSQTFYSLVSFLKKKKKRRKRNDWHFLFSFLIYVLSLSKQGLGWWHSCKVKKCCRQGKEGGGGLSEATLEGSAAACPIKDHSGNKVWAEKQGRLGCWRAPHPESPPLLSDPCSSRVSLWLLSSTSRCFSCSPWVMEKEPAL